jgi:hypothetical protein
MSAGTIIEKTVIEKTVSHREDSFHRISGASVAFRHIRCALHQPMVDDVEYGNGSKPGAKRLDPMLVCTRSSTRKPLSFLMNEGKKL